MNKAFMVAVDFYEKLDPSLKNKINFNINDKLQAYEVILNDQIAVSARVSLIEGHWNEALIQYKSLFLKGNSSIKLQSFIGIICAIFRKDFEWVSVITCKPKLRGAFGEWDSTLFDKNNNLSIFFKIQIFVFKVFLRLDPNEYFIDFLV